MALSRADHKRIAQGIVGELRKVLSLHGADRIMAKHRARMAPKDEQPPEPSDDDQEALEAIAGQDDQEPDDDEAPPTRPFGGKEPGKRLPFKVPFKKR